VYPARMDHPCRTCGACCAAFRVSFYWGEPVPAELTVPVTPFRAAMSGTEREPSRCVALDGAVGGPVACRIYADRPSPCRELTASFTFGVREDHCDLARSKHGLPPLTSEEMAPFREWGTDVPPARSAGGPDAPQT
jgi:uncharacterized protein